jgi:hypothetical protein
VELLEDRLTPSWSSTPPATITPPSNYTSVNLNSAGDATGNAFITSNEVDWYRFTATNGGSYTFEATTPNSSMDTVIATYTVTGSRVGYNDDISSTNRDSRFTVTLAAGQVFFFGATNFLGTSGGSYTWRIDGPAAGTDDIFEENDTLATAANLGTLTAQQTWSNLKMADSADWYKFTMSGTGTTANFVQIAFTHSQGDLELRLYNSSGTQIGSSEGATNTENISLNGLAAGTYYVQVFGYQGAINPNYSLTVNPGTGAGGGTGGFQITLRLTGMSASQQAIFQQAANRWAQIITGDLPNATYNGIAVDDVLIDASAVAIDGRGGILGQAGPDRLRSGSFLPYHGTMQFDTADMAALETSGGLYYTILHEMGHVLGVGTIWSQKGLLTGAGTTNPRFTGAQATAQYNAIFGTNVTGVPVENTGGGGTRDAHWREATFGNELMTGWLNGGVNPLSRVTAASMADLGYTVNISAADNYPPPGGGAGGSGGGGGAAGLRAGEDLKLNRKLQFTVRDLTSQTTVIAPLPKSSPAARSSQALAPVVAQQTTTARVGTTTEASATPCSTDAAFANYDRLGGIVTSLI